MQLTATNRDLKECEADNMAQLDAVQANSAASREEGRVQKLALNNQRRSLQKELEQAQAQAVDWEAQYRKVQASTTRRTLLLGRIRM